VGVAKDRAAPFSRKHRKYWMTVLGGMVAIAVLDVGIGMCSYKPAPPTEAMTLVIPVRDAAVQPFDAANSLAPHAIPADVMRAFAVKYPRTIPTGATRNGDLYTVEFPAGAPHAHATFRLDGTFVSED
jgi:hypothetical protein